MYFRVNLKMKKPTFCSCLIWIVLIELSFTIAFQLIRKTWDEWFVGKVGGEGGGMWDFKKGGGWFWNEEGGWYPLTDYVKLAQ